MESGISNSHLMERTMRVGIRRSTEFCWDFKQRLADSLESWSSRLHPDDKGRVVQVFNRHLSTPDRKYDVEARMRCADGVYRWFRSQGSTHRSASRAPLRTVGVMTTIQAKKDRAWLIEQQTERQARLEEGLARINGIVGEIRTISRQTTMLALNAAIEVTRVGKVGQGFGVLANELKILAQRINTATLKRRRFTAY